MATSRKTNWIARSLSAALSLLTLAPWTVALASQGPGTGPGTASSFNQLTMAVLVYGTAAIVLCAGLIGALRRH